MAILTDLFICPGYLECIRHTKVADGCLHRRPHYHNSACGRGCTPRNDEEEVGGCRPVTEEDCVIAKLIGWEWNVG